MQMRSLTLPTFGLLLAVLAMSPGTGLAAGEILVDDFALPADAEGGILGTDVSDPFFGAYLDPSLMHILGGERELLIQTKGAGTPTSSFSIGGGSFSFTSGDPGAAVTLIYDGDLLPPPGTLDISNLQDLRIDFDFVSTGGAASVPIVVYFESAAGNIAFLGELTSNDAPFSYFATSGSFSDGGTFDPTAVVHTVIAINPEGIPGLEFRLNRIVEIEAVPEPSSVALASIGLGLLTIAHRRRALKRHEQ
ncbi:MAG: PEP-CTERM sorting domain-containing protein [Pirellulales bacterium]|nr:PEP-CTERM sorting domain-containing protein [Pirellulales bacterium]